MMGFEKPNRGPLLDYEIVYNSGYVETVQAHQVMMPPGTDFMLGDVATKSEQRWTFHGEFDGHWQLVLSVPAEDVKSVRNVTRARDDAERGAES